MSKQLRAFPVTGSSVYLILPMAVLNIAIFAIPILYFFQFSFTALDDAASGTPAGLLSNYASIAASNYYRSLAGRTLGLAILATIFVVLLAIPVAMWIRRLGKRGQSVVLTLFVVPFMVGGVVRSLGWIGLLSDRGLINRSLIEWGILAEPLGLLHTNQAVLLGIVSIELPMMIILATHALGSVPGDLELAAMDLGGGPLNVLFSVTLRIATPGLLAAAILVFIQSMNTYVTARLLGGPTVPMMATAIYDEFTTRADWGMGAALSVVLLLMTLTVNFVVSRVFRPTYLRKARL